MTEENHFEQTENHSDNNAPAEEGVTKPARGRRAASAARTAAGTTGEGAANGADTFAAPTAKGKTGAAGKKTGRPATAKTAAKRAAPGSAPSSAPDAAPDAGAKAEGAAADRETPARSSRGGRRTGATRKSAASAQADTSAATPGAEGASGAGALPAAPESGDAFAAEASARPAARGKTSSGGRKTTTGRRTAAPSGKAPEGEREAFAASGSAQAVDVVADDASVQTPDVPSASADAPFEAAEKKSRGRTRGGRRAAAKSGAAEGGQASDPLSSALDFVREGAIANALSAGTMLNADDTEQGAEQDAERGAGENIAVGKPAEATRVDADAPFADIGAPPADQPASLGGETPVATAEDSAVAAPDVDPMFEVTLLLPEDPADLQTTMPLPDMELVQESVWPDVWPDAGLDVRLDAELDDVLSDFPSTFGDSGPEDFFGLLEESETGEDEAGDAAPVAGEKRRRSRSRRGRGKRRATAQAAAGDQDAVAGQERETDESQDAVAAKARTKALETGARHARSADEEDDSFPPFTVDEAVDVTEDEDFADEYFADEDAEDEARGRLGAEARSGGKSVRRKMFVSVLPEEQVEVVITEEGQVQEYYVEMLHQAKTKGNIYKGVVHNVDPNLQAAFVSYGAVKNGFLQIDEVHPEYYVAPHDAVKGRKYPPIQKVLKSGQELLVQVVKEPAGTKGAFLTTYLSLPGRFLVLTPGREQIGVSRKVENETERARLREMLEGLSPGPGLGVIVRTVSMGASKTSLQRDLQFLQRTWKEVRARGTTEKAPCLVYQEVDLTSRAVRDYLTENIGEVWIDDEPTAIAVAEIAEALFPRKHNLVRAHKDPGASLFERFNIQRQLDQIHSREVSLPSGGRLVIDPTEALTAIDINSGRSSGKSNFEDMAYRTNMEAAKMIPLQLRLRDIGGQVVADFIEMRDKNHWREVEKTLRNGMKVDRARYDVGKIGPFGMLEIVRQRLGSSAISISTEPCPCCNGTGVRRNMEWRSQHALRDILRLMRSAQAQNEPSVVYSADQSLALHLLNLKRQRLLEMEQLYGVRLDILIRPQEVV